MILWSGQPLLPDFMSHLPSTQYSFSESPLRLHYFSLSFRSHWWPSEWVIHLNTQKKTLKSGKQQKQGFKFNWIQFPSVLFPWTWTHKSHQQSPNFQVRRSLQAASTPLFGLHGSTITSFTPHPFSIVSVSFLFPFPSRPGNLSKPHYHLPSKVSALPSWPSWPGSRTQTQHLQASRKFPTCTSLACLKFNTSKLGNQPAFSCLY